MNIFFTQQRATMRLKILVLLSSSLFILNSVSAQNAAQYGFSTQSGTFTEITGGTNLSAIQQDDAYSAGVPIGFSFNFCGTSYTTVTPCSNGWMSFTNPGGSYLSNFLGSLGSITPCVMPLWDDLNGATSTAVPVATYITTGVAPNRVFTMEWKNWRWSWSTATAVVSFQVKLFEGTNIIQCVYRPEASAPSGPSATIGIAKNGSDYQTLNNTSTTPISAPTFTDNISGNPASGQIYQWSPPAPCAGMPTAGTAVSSPTSVCQGANVLLSTTGGTVATGLTYQWQEFNGTTWVNAVGGGATTPYFNSPNLFAQKQYRVVITCIATSQSDTSTVKTVSINVSGLPYLETFESITADNQLPNCMTSTNLNNYTYTNTFGNSYNRSNHTPGGSKYGSFRYGADDWFFSPSLPLAANQDYRVSFWYVTDGLSGWQTLEAKLGNGNNPGAMIIAVGAPITGPNNTTYQQFSGVVRVPTAGNYNLGIHCIGNFSPWYLTIDDIGLAALAPCSGTPTAGSIFPTGTQSPCAGSTVQISATGTTISGNLVYQWLQSTIANPNYVPVVGGTGGNTEFYTTPPLSDTIRYRLRITCTNSNQSDLGPIVTFNVTGPTYAALPYVQSFESWISRCSTTDLPDQSWTNNPETGDNSWRREDQGASAGWINGTSGNFNQQTAFDGLHFARFHVYGAATNTPGKLSLHLDCSGTIGQKQLEFAYRGDPSIYAGDTLKVMLSTNGGGTFSQIGIYNSGNANWVSETILFTSTSAKTILKFEITSNSSYYNDFNLDLVRVLPPCVATPIAGVITPVSTCIYQDFTLALTGNSQAAGIVYDWQRSSNGVTGWQSIPGTNRQNIVQNISSETYYRVIANCVNSNLADTTAPILVKLNDFYLCYCPSGASSYFPLTTFPNEDIGNFTLASSPDNNVLFNNGVGTPLTNNLTAGNSYSNFTNLPAPTLYQDSTYKASIQQVTYNGSNVNSRVVIYIDYNRNGQYEPNEKAFSRGTTFPAYQSIDSFKIPNTTGVGKTGMRVILWRGGQDAPPCGIYNSFGETEDYLVNLAYPPCTGAATAGAAFIDKDSTCAGYTVNIGDTTYERRRSKLARVWQSSSNGGFDWITIPNSANKDTLNRVLVSVPTQYRLRVICLGTNDTTYSQITKVGIKQPWKCYCVSYADGGPASDEDISDVGFFRVGPYSFNTGGPHVNNQAAVRDRTDNTDIPNIELFADSTYTVDFYHIIKPSFQANAKVTMFIDYNNNLIYDAPQERVFSGQMDSLSFYTTTTLKIPSMVVPNLPTGMRVIINNNTGANVPSDMACGTYASGETEDYVITLRIANKLSVVGNKPLQSLAVYPNPSEGIFTVRLNGSVGFKDVSISIMNMAGQHVGNRTFTNTTNTIATDFDLSSLSRGIYFVEVRADGDKMIKKLVIQ